MSWISKLKGVFTAEKKGADMSALGNLFGANGLWWSLSQENQAELMRQARGWAFTCISKIADEVGNIRLRLYRTKGKERKDWEEIEDHPLLDLLNRPNDDMQRFELFQLWSMHDDLTGSAYWLLEDVRDEEATPTGIIPLNPAHMKVAMVKDSFPPKVANFVYEASGVKKVFQRHEIIHFKRINPNNPFTGLGPTEIALDSIDSLNWANEWNKKFFQNSGRPGLILETEGVDQAGIDLLRRTFEDKFVGAEKAHKTAVLPRGVKVADKGNLSQKDMDFTELVRQMRDAILAHYGVPHVVLGLGAGENLNRATADTTDYVFARRTIQPKDMRFVSYLNAYLVPRFGDDLVLDFDDPVPANIEMQVKEDQAALGGAPYKSINEVRAERGLPPISGGDAVMGTAFQEPVGEPEKNLKKPSLEKKSLVICKSRARMALAARNDFASIMAQKALEVVELVKMKRVQKLKDLKTENWEPRWEAMVKRVEPKEKDIKSAMSEYAEGMTKRAISELKKQEKDIKGKDLLDKDDEVAAIIKLLEPIYQEILLMEGTSAAEMIDAAFDATDKRTQASLAKALKLMSVKYTQETIALLDAALSEGISEGDSLDQLTKRVQKVGDFSSKKRAETVAKTEAFRVANFSTKEAWKQSGVVSTIKWYTAEDERVCSFCGPQGDKPPIPIDEDFYEKGDTVEGVDAEGNKVTLDLTYSNVEAPPLHPNCRCYIRPEDISA